MKSLHIDFKLPNARKVRSFIIYPLKSGETNAVLQADDAIMQVDMETGTYIYNVRAGGAYFLHLHPRLGAKKAEGGLELVKAINGALVPAGTEVVFHGVLHVEY